MRLRTVFFVGLLAAGYGYLWYTQGLRPVDAASTARQVVDIPKGLSTQDIAELLQEKGVIRSATVFRLYARWKGLEESLQAGNFVLQPSLSVADLLQSLTKGVAKELAVTIPEGYTVTDIDALLARRGLAATGAFLACAQSCDVSAFSFLPARAGLAERGGRVEGYLFPDTYFVVPGALSAESFLNRLLHTFDEKVVQGFASDIATSQRPLHDIVTMASLVEEEAANDAERPAIAGILWKRDDAGTSLGVDAAVRYILRKPSDEITRTDLDIDSPYNLRKYPGLPPGPIANPGIASIRAALHPEQTPYWYYLHGRDGRIRYAETNDEHNANRARYL